MPITLAKGEEPVPGYHLVKPLGQGGFGQVWEAEAPGRMRVALKFIRTDTGHSDPERRAIDAIRDIRHPHLLEMHFCLTVEDHLVIATSLCDKSLLDRFWEFTAKGEPGMPLDPLLRYMEETAVAIDFLNEARHVDGDGRTVGIQHRDIKPQNIFLVGDSVKVADFGLAKALEHSVTSHTGAMTPYYAPPEMFRNAVARTSDQYSLAVSYVQLRTGQLPFAGSVHQIIYAHLHEPPNLDGLLPEEKPIVTRALSKEPTQRWASCGEFIAALKQASLFSAPVHFTPRAKAGQPAAILEPGQPVRSDTEETKPARQAREPTRRKGGRALKNPSADRSRRKVGVVTAALSLLTLTAAVVVYLATNNGISPDKLQSNEKTEPTEVAKSSSTEPPSEAKSGGMEQHTLRLERTPVPPLAVAPFDPHKAKQLQEQWAAYLNTKSVIENSIGMKLALIPPGEFMMGSKLTTAELANRFNITKENAEELYAHEYPRHQVRITQPYFVGVHEVTVGQFRQFVEEVGYRTESERDGFGGWGFNTKETRFERGPQYDWKHTGYSEDESHPVVNVDWNDALAFVKWLSKKTGDDYRLLTEAQWEYACRAGSETLFHSGDTDANLVRVGNVGDETARKVFGEKTNPLYPWLYVEDGYAFTAPVGRHAPNAFGLYDMHGNVWEWCSDWYAEDYYEQSPRDDPSGPPSANHRVYRGGSWVDSSVYCRSAGRGKGARVGRNGVLGFRVALAHD